MKHNKSTAKVFTAVITLFLLTVSLAVFVSAEDITVSAPTFRLVSSTTQSVKIAWETTDEVYCFKVYKMNNETGKYETVYKGRKTEMTVDGLSPGTEYLFAVRAYIIADAKTYKSSLIKLTCNTKLDTVKGINQSETTSTSHRLTWKRIDGADGYQIYFYNTEKKKYVLIGQTSKSTCKLTGLSSAYTYTYKIRAFSLKKDGSKLYAKASAAFNAVTLPAAVTSFTASSVTTSSFNLKWSAAERSDGYRIYEQNPETKKYTVVATVKNVDSLGISSKASAHSYTYVIRSYARLNGKTYFSELSKPLTVTTKPVTPTAKIKADLPGNGNIKVAWSKVEGADGYLIYISDRKNSGFVLKKKVSAKTLEYTLTGLDTRKTTYIKVKAFVSVGDKMVYSANSKLISAKA